jgi:hypothetical protein
MLGAARVALLLVSLLGTLATTVGSASAAGWLAPASTQPGSHEVDSEDLELDAQGNATAVWVEYAPWRVVKAATRPRGGVWSQPVTLSNATEEGAWNPQVAVGANGETAVLWSSNYHPPAQTQTVFAVTREAGGEWSRPVEISKQGGRELTWQPQVVVDAEGNATAIWSEETELADAIVTSTRPKGGEWSAPVEVSAKEEAVGDRPELAVDSQGDVTAVWIWHVGESERGIVQSATRPAGGAWSAPVDLSATDGRAVLSQLAVDPRGDAVAVWKSETAERVQAASRTANGTWGAAVDLSEGEAYEPDVAIDPQGNATAVWESNDGVGRLVHTSTSALGGQWSVPVDISERDEANWIGAFPQIVVDSQGNATAAWRAYREGGINYIQAARREAAGQWSRAVDVGRGSGVLEDFPLAVDPQGYVTAAWSRGQSVYSSVFDAVAPELNVLEVPATGLVGQTIAMSVDPFDVWSSVLVSWDLGDGSFGTGAQVDHCYSSPGQHTVTITGTDAAANAASASRVISIEPNPALAPGSDPCARGQPAPLEQPNQPGQAGSSSQPTASEQPAAVVQAVPSGSGLAGGGAVPVVSGLRQTSSRWRAGHGRGRSRLPLGTTFHFELDRPARVQFVFMRITHGRREQACGSVEIAGKAGPNSYRFRGKIHGHALGPGRYRLLLSARADGEISAVASIGFTIAR